MLWGTGVSMGRMACVSERVVENYICMDACTPPTHTHLPQLPWSCSVLFSAVDHPGPRDEEKKRNMLLPLSRANLLTPSTPNPSFRLSDLISAEKEIAFDDFHNWMKVQSKYPVLFLLFHWPHHLHFHFLCCDPLPLLFNFSRSFPPPPPPPLCPRFHPFTILLTLDIDFCSCLLLDSVENKHDTQMADDDENLVPRGSWCFNEHLMKLSS